MAGMFETVQLLIKVGGLLMFGFFVLLAMPQSKLRDVVMPFVGWAVAALSAAYVVLPFDLVPEALLGPFGLVDDVAAVVMAIYAACGAMAASKRLAESHEAEAKAAEAVEPAVSTPHSVAEALDVEVIEA